MSSYVKISIFLLFFSRFGEIRGQDSTTASPLEAAESESNDSTTAVILTTTIPSCSINETYLLCSSVCENRCDMPTESCGNQCGPPMCQCIDGFYRNVTGNCVQGHDCGLHDTPKLMREPPMIVIPPNSPNATDCSEIYCPDGSNCLLVAPQNCELDCSDNDTCSSANCGSVPTCVPDVVIYYHDRPNKTCPDNETWTDCSTDCENTCVSADQNCTNLCGPPKCQCSDGFYRNSTGTCVQGHDCGSELSVTQLPSTEGIFTGCDLIVCTNGTICKNVDGKAGCVANLTNTCSMNEEWKDCASNCEPSCSDFSPVCAAVCAPSGCQCVQGFYRDGNDTCVVRSDCKTPVLTCPDPNEVVKNCGTSCEPTCENPNLQCGEDCDSLAQTCQCAPGFVRNAIMDCVSLTACNESLPTNCSTVTCPINKYCGLVNGFAKCLENPSSSTMITPPISSNPFTEIGTIAFTTTMATLWPNPITGTTTGLNLVCGSNERVTQCKLCEETCRGTQICTHNPICQKGCVCVYGYKRGPTYKCVKNNQCYKNPGCETNEEWVKCIAHEAKCPIVANSTEPIFGRQCFSGCGCTEGFSRDSHGFCVPPTDCS